MLHELIEKFSQELGLKVSIQAEEVLLSPGERFDALAAIKLGKTELPFVIEVKKEVMSPESVRHFLSKIKRPFLPLIVALEISPHMKEHLRSRGVAFLAKDGDFFLPFSNTYSQRRIVKNDKALDYHRIHGMGYNKLGFALLRMPKCRAMNLTQLAQTLKISLGALSKILNEWERQGFIHNAAQEKRVVNVEEFSKRWATAYVDTIKYHDTIFLGRYRSAIESFFSSWNKLNLNVGDVWWGGEPAAALITRQLTPERFQMYCGKNLNKVISSLRLVPDPNGNITICRPFWFEFPDSFDFHQSLISDPLVVYADLIYSDSSRNRKISETLLREFLL